MTDTVEEVKKRLTIQDVVSGYVKLDRAGSVYKARCPFHAERTPSFVVSPERGTYHCFGCNVGGDIFSFVEAIEGLDFKGALKILADRAGVPIVYKGKRQENKDEKDRLFEGMEAAAIFYTKSLDEKHPARAYLHERGLTDESIKIFRVGFAPEGWQALSDHLKERGFSDKELIDMGLSKKGDKGIYDRFRNRIMFPINDSAGRIVAFSGRIFDPEKKASADTPKYINSPETMLFKKSNVLYGFDRAKQLIRKYNVAVLVEGQMDLIAVHQVGWSNAVGVSGTAFTTEHGALIRRMTDNLIIALDADEAGIKAAARAARAALSAGLHVKLAQLPSGSDPADLIKAQGEDAWKASMREAKDIISFLLDTVALRSTDASGNLNHEKFRRSVEVAVLPFLADVQSPIEKEHYVRTISERISVSPEAISETLSKLPEARSVESQQKNEKNSLSAGDGATIRAREKQIAGILLWQEELSKPHVDIELLTKRVEEVMGNDRLKDIRDLPKKEQEALRFAAEAVLSDAGSISANIEATILVYLREKLNAEMATVSRELQVAERNGEDEKVAQLLEKSKLLTGEIARLTKIL